MASGVRGAPIAVVGAGLAGLSAAWELTRLGFEVEIFERSRLVGGKATSFEVGGVEFDNGQHVFLGCFDEWLRLVGEAGMADKLHLQERFEVVLLAPGRATRLRAASWPSPLHLLPALVRHRPLGLRGRLQVARAMRAARRPAHPGETAAAWLRRLGQSAQARAMFWDPFLIPALNAPLEDVDAETARSVITTAFLGGPEACRIGWSRVPLARIAEALARRASRLHLRTAVVGIEISRGQVTTVQTTERRHPVSGVVLAVPPHQLDRLLPPDAAVSPRGFTSQPIVDVHLWYERDRLELPGNLDFAALIGSPVQWVFRKQPGYLCCSLSAAGDLVTRPEGELVDLCHRELANVLPRLRGTAPREGRATRDPQATFVPAPGLHRPGPVTGLLNLVLAGAWTDTGLPATMESAARSGRAAARALAPRLDGIASPTTEREVAVS
jgi:hydroxysqualene dehydroxylase